MLQYEPDSDITVTPCKHSYHKDCLEVSYIFLYITAEFHGPKLTKVDVAQPAECDDGVVPDVQTRHGCPRLSGALRAGPRCARSAYRLDELLASVKLCKGSQWRKTDQLAAVAIWMTNNDAGCTKTNYVVEGYGPLYFCTVLDRRSIR